MQLPAAFAVSFSCLGKCRPKGTQASHSCCYYTKSSRQGKDLSHFFRDSLPQNFPGRCCDRDTRPGRCCNRDTHPGRCNDNGPGLIRGLRTRLMKGMRARADATFLRSVALRAPSRSKSYLPVAYPQTGKYPARNGHPRKPLIRSSRSGQADGQITFFEVKCPQGTSRKKLHLPTPPSSRSQAADHLPTPPSSALKPPHSSSITSLFILRSTALLTFLRTISVISPSIFSDGR